MGDDRAWDEALYEIAKATRTQGQRQAKAVEQKVKKMRLEWAAKKQAFGFMATMAMLA
jgi:hypothetical protein